MRRRLAQQAAEIERAAGLRPGAGKAGAAERLHADRGADDVAVDVDVAGLDAVDHARDRLVDARVQAEGEAVAGGVDVADQPVEVGALEAQHMQHRAEDFALDVGDAADLDQRRRDEGSAAPSRAAAAPACDREAAGAHGVDVAEDVGARLLRDDRADVGRQLARIADLEFRQRALQHRQRALGDVFLQAEDAQAPSSAGRRNRRRRR